MTCGHDDSITYVYKKDGGSTIKQEVAVGITNDDYAVIEFGIAKEDKLYLSIPEGAEDLELNPLSPTQALPENAAKAEL